MKKNISRIALFSTVLIVMGSCAGDFLDTEPSRTISQEQLGSSATGTEALLSGIYVSLRSPTDDGGATDYGHKAVGNFGDMMSNDATNNGPGYNWWVNTMELEGREKQNREAFIPWQVYYRAILSANGLINAIDPATEDPELQAILGQGLAIRAFGYHNLVRTYGKAYSLDPSAPGVPIYDGTSFEGQPRSTVQEVYNQAVSDIETAITLLDGFARPNKQFINQNVAYGIAAKIYLDMENYTAAASAASNARSGFTVMSGAEYVADGFSALDGNAGFMWGAYIDSETTTFYSSWVSHWGNLDPGYAGLVGSYKLIDRGLYDLIPATDVRKTAFNGSTSDQNATVPPYSNLKFEDKATNVFEADYVYMRAAEMLLIEAEASVASAPATAQSLLFELVSTRDASYTQSTSTGQTLLDEIYLQRRIELWGEGEAFYDLKRLQLPINRTYAGSNHFIQVDKPANDNVFVFQIPEEEIQANSQISESDQNPL